jgi:hypothetical protein
MGSVLVAIDGEEVWAYAVEAAGGLRLRLDIHDWQRLNLARGQRVPVRLPGSEDTRLFITGATEQPPVVWVEMAERIRAAG